MEKKKGKGDYSNKKGQKFESKKILNFYKLKGTSSFISCHGRPNSKDISFLKNAYGINYVLTLQYPKEKPEEVKKWCEQSEVRWQMIELFGANLPYFRKRSTQIILTKGILELYKILTTEKVKLFIHCAAGVHRTGTVVYSLLRLFGESPESAMTAIKYIREETYLGVGEERISFAEQYIVPNLIKSINGEDFIFENEEQLDLNTEHLLYAKELNIGEGMEKLKIGEKEEEKEKEEEEKEI